MHILRLAASWGAAVAYIQRAAEKGALRKDISPPWSPRSHPLVSFPLSKFAPVRLSTMAW